MEFLGIRVIRMNSRISGIHRNSKLLLIPSERSGAHLKRSTAWRAGIISRSQEFTGVTRWPTPLRCMCGESSTAYADPTAKHVGAGACQSPTNWDACALGVL